MNDKSSTAYTLYLIGLMLNGVAAALVATLVVPLNGGSLMDSLTHRFGITAANYTVDALWFVIFAPLVIVGERLCRKLAALVYRWETSGDDGG